MLHEVYKDFMEQVMAVPVMTGLKTPAETFPGADRSWTCEGMMRDGKALQMGTSHELGPELRPDVRDRVPDRDQVRTSMSGRRPGGHRRG